MTGLRLASACHWVWVLALDWRGLQALDLSSFKVASVERRTVGQVGNVHWLVCSHVPTTLNGNDACVWMGDR